MPKKMVNMSHSQLQAVYHVYKQDPTLTEGRAYLSKAATGGVL